MSHETTTRPVVRCHRDFVGDGEFVIWVSEGMQPGKLMFNMVRIVNGKMKEHWDST